MPFLMNSNVKPMDVNNEPFLYEQNMDIAGKNHEFDKNPGKWMMFHSKSILDEKWAEARRLYNDGALLGIHSMKVSTDYINPRASCESTGVIIFYCGPANDEDKMLKIGRNLLEHISYENNWLYYKSDQQTAQGTRATGIRVNHLYKIEVQPKTD